MNNSILLRSNATFEPHLQERKELPFIIHRNMGYSAGRGCRSNLHRNIEILQFISGKGVVICGEDRYDVIPGDTVVVNSYLAHRVLAEEDILFNCLIVGSDFCEENAIDISLTSFTPKLTDAAVTSLIDDVMTSYSRQDQLWRARVRCSVLTLLIHLCQNHSVPRSTAVTEDHAFRSVIEAIGFIKDNLDKKLSVEQVAQQAGFSKYYFLRLFKRVTGCTLVQYINLLRCETAKELLRSGNHTVKETALLCGFDNLSYFTSVFKKHTGYLPGAYRVKQGGMDYARMEPL